MNKAKLYCVVKMGVYCQGVFHIGRDLEKAKAEADLLASEDSDDYHSWEVLESGNVHGDQCTSVYKTIKHLTRKFNVSELGLYSVIKRTDDGDTLYDTGNNRYEMENQFRRIKNRLPETNWVFIEPPPIPVISIGLAPPVADTGKYALVAFGPSGSKIFWVGDDMEVGNQMLEKAKVRTPDQQWSIIDNPKKVVT